MILTTNLLIFKNVLAHHVPLINEDIKGLGPSVDSCGGKGQVKPTGRSSGGFTARPRKAEDGPRPFFLKYRVDNLISA